MSENRQAPLHFQVFLSSPSDVADERALVRRLLKDELPYDPFLRGRATFDVVSWDDSAVPTPMPATLRPQEAVNRKLPKPSECDIVIVVLWSRLGTLLSQQYRKPNDEDYLSGIKREVENACNAERRPAILVYRRAEKVKIEIDDPQFDEKRDQYLKVEKFFSRFRNSDGSLRPGVSTYETPTEFKDRLANDLKYLIWPQLDKLNARAEPATPEPAPSWKGSPYPGLRAFTSEEALIFFGRGRETDTLIARLRDPDQRFLAVVGASGTGKSSLLRAGLLPRLKNGAIEGSQYWHVVTSTPGSTGDNPFLSLATSLTEVLRPHERKSSIEVAQALERSPQMIIDYARRLATGCLTGTQLVLVFEQLEQLFTVVAETHRSAFTELLSSAAGDPCLRVLATLRSDFLPQCLAELKLATLLQAGAFPLGPPDKAALTDIIRKPAEYAGLELEDNLVGRIVNDAGSDPGVLPLVASCLEELYRHTAPEHRLTLKAYTELGGLCGAIGRRAEALLEDIRKSYGDAIDVALSRIFRAIVHVEAAGPKEGTATRRIAFRDELSTEPPFPQLIEMLIRQRLLIAGEIKGRATIEIAFEALFEGWPVLRAWLERNRADLIQCDELAVDMEHWESTNKDENFLLPEGDRLDKAVALAEQRPELLDSQMRVFIEASRARVRERQRLLHESRRLAALAEQETAAGNAKKGILIAVEALPRDLVHPERPYVRQAEIALYTAIFAYEGRWILRGHASRVNSVAFDPAGERIVTASGDGTARLWDAVSGQECAVLRGHESWVWSAAFSPDGSLVVTASTDGTARLWDVVSGQKRAVLRGHEGAVTSAAFSPDGQRVVTASVDKTARLWDVVSGQECAVLRGHGDKVWSATFSPDGQSIITTSWDQTARLWDSISGQERAVLHGYTSWVTSAAFSPDGQHLVTAANDNTARLWDSISGQECAVLRGHTNWVTSAAFSPDGQRLVTTSSDNTARLWDAISGQECAVLRGHTNWVTSAAFSPDGRRLVTTSSDNTARLWDVVSGQECAVLRGHEDTVWSAAFSPDGQRLVTTSSDNTAQLWRVFGSTQELIDYARSISTETLTEEQLKLLLSELDAGHFRSNASRGRETECEANRGLVPRQPTTEGKHGAGSPTSLGVG